MGTTRSATARAALSLVHVPEPPSAADFYEALNGPLWEALAVAAEDVVTARPSRGPVARLIAMGLLHRSNGRPTAAGYALLLRWHRKHRRGPGRLWPWPRARESRHVRRMRQLWGC